MGFATRIDHREGPQGTRSVGRETFFKCVLIVLVVGTPNLNLFDITGLSQEYGRFNVSSALRAFVYMSAAIATAIALLKLRKLSSASGMRLIWAFYAWAFLSTILIWPDFGDLALSIYRLAEWVIVILIVQELFTHPKDCPRIFIQFLKLSGVYAVAVISIVAVYDSELVYLYSQETGTYRFGGVANHPNNLGLILGLSALAWFISERGLLRFAVPFTLIVLSILCWSRTCTAATIAAFSVYFLARMTIHREANARTLFIAVIGFFTSVAAALLASNAILSFVARGQGRDYLSGFAGRSDVWLGSIALIEESAWLGHGFIIGPKLLRYSAYVPDHWAAPNAHNDILNAGVSGGLIAIGLLVLIYLVVGTHCIRQIRNAPILFSCFVAITITSITSNALSDDAVFRGILVVALARAASVSLGAGGLINQYGIKYRTKVSAGHTKPVIIR